MTMTKNCTLLAAALSENFWNATRFDPVRMDLKRDYLPYNGILTSMCVAPNHTCYGLDNFANFGYPSFDSMGFNHISASWFNSRTGIRTYGNASQNLDSRLDGGDYEQDHDHEHDGENVAISIGPHQSVGLIFDPILSDILCIYPTDASTDVRDSNGCGPYYKDPRYGSRGAAQTTTLRRYLNRFAWSLYKIVRFGYGRDWTDIPCRHFFDMYEVLHMSTGWYTASDDDHDGDHDRKPLNGCDVMPNARNIRYEAWHEVVQQHLSAIGGMGRLCRDDEPEPKFAPGVDWQYSGHCSFGPHLWQDMVDSMVDVFHATESRMNLYNEIVLDRPVDVSDGGLGDLVGAVFYFVAPSTTESERHFRRQLAREKASLLKGDQPVLALHLDAVDPEARRRGAPLFTCDDEEPKQPPPHRHHHYHQEDENSSFSGTFDHEGEAPAGTSLDVSTTTTTTQASVTGANDGMEL